MTAISLVISFLLPVLAAPAGQLHVVDGAGGPGSQFVGIAQAIAAAQTGDTILVRTGVYEEFTLSKGLVLTAEQGAIVEVPRFTVIDLPPGEAVSIHGIGTSSPSSGPGATIRDCNGPVWIEDCTLNAPLQPLAVGSEGVRVTRSVAVTLNRCSVLGSSGLVMHAGPGLLANKSYVAVFDSTLTGGQGSTDIDAEVNWLPGPGVELNESMLTLSGCELTGGDGSSGTLAFGCLDAGDGAPGIEVDLGAMVHSQDTTMIGGSGGVSTQGCQNGASGEGSLLIDGTLFDQPFPARSLRAPTPVRAGQSFEVRLTGVPGDLMVLWFSPVQAPSYFQPLAEPLAPILGGTFLPEVSTASTVRAGLIPASGQKFSSFSAPDTGLPALQLYVQALFRSAPMNGGLGVTSGQGLTLLQAGS